MLPAPALGATGEDPAPSQQSGGAPARAEPARTMLIARVLVNTVNKGDIAILRDAQGRTFVPLTEYAKWGLSPPSAHR